MILATELGKDPLLRQEMRNRFKRDAVVSVQPTERGITKIDEHHPYFVRALVDCQATRVLKFLRYQNFKYLHKKRAEDLTQSPQFLHILAAETEHLVTVSVTLPAEVFAQFERQLVEAFSSDSYSDAGRAWNAERLRVVQETLEQHLIPVAVKWTREWIREEAEEFLCRECAYALREVSNQHIFTRSLPKYVIADRNGSIPG
jgi:transcription elongation factor SPT6